MYQPITTLNACARDDIPELPDLATEILPSLGELLHKPLWGPCVD
jgi:hypothetical protein